MANLKGELLLIKNRLLYPLKCKDIYIMEKFGDNQKPRTFDGDNSE